MAKKDPIALVLDTGISSASSLTSGIKQNLGVQDQLPGERQVNSSMRSLSSAIEELSPITQAMNMMGDGGIGINLPKGEEVMQMFANPDQPNIGPDGLPTPPGLDQAPQFVQDLLPNMGGQSGSVKATATNSADQVRRDNTKNQNRSRRKDLYKLDPY